MSPWVGALLSVVSGLLVVWIVLVVALYAAGRRAGEPTTLREALRVLPDVIRLLRRLAADPGLPRGVRVRLAVVVAYLLLPVDLVPDFIPVVGFADDAVIVGLVLRAVVRSAGPDALERHWRGSAQGLRVVRVLAGLPGQPRDPSQGLARRP